MHLNLKKHIFLLLECTITTLICSGLTYLFLNLFKAEGFSKTLLSWTTISSIMLFASFRTESRNRLVRFFIKLITFFLLVGGGLLLLLQLGATQRSLAEAWLDYARKGEPFGFFSFFATELYAFLLLVSVVFIANKKYITGIFVFLAINTLGIGIVTGNQFFLVLAVVLLLFPLLYKKRWQSFIFPSLCAALLTLIFSFAGTEKGFNAVSKISFDSTSIMESIAPDFPLMVHIPGYGFSVNVSKPQNTVSLSNRSIFSVQGEPNQTLYFVTDRFSSWYGTTWNRDYFDSDTIPLDLYFDNETTAELSSDLQKVQLRLTEDFYSVIPCTSNTVAVNLPSEYENNKVKANSENTLELQPGLKHGTQITLFIDNNQDNITENGFTITEEQSFEVSEIPPKISELSNELFAKAQVESKTESVTNSTESTELTTERLYIRKALAYFQDGFTYSLESPSAPIGQDEIEYFVFESKTGFCTWFASSFALLMKAQNIPCRMTEGFRISLDEFGQGRISGMNAHAWPEVFIDGNWRIFEPTPVYSTNNPFAYINKSDKKTLKLFSTLQNEEQSSSTKTTHSFLPNIQIIKILALILLVVLSITAGFLFYFYKKPEKRLLRHARRIVKKYNRKGIPSPTECGWVEWKDSVLQQKATEKETQTATQIAQDMIDYLYKV